MAVTKRRAKPVSHKRRTVSGKTVHVKGRSGSARRKEGGSVEEIKSTLKGYMTVYGKGRKAGKKANDPSIRAAGEAIGRIKAGLAKANRRR